MEQAAASPEEASVREPTVERLQRLLGEVAGFVDWLRDHHFGTAAAPGTADSGLSGKGLLHTLKLILARVLDDPSDFAQQYARFASLVLQASRQELDLSPEPGDRRFKDPLWQTSPVHRMLLQVYLAWQHSLAAWADTQTLSAQDRQAVQFVLDQLLSALSPSNLPLHPAALKRAESTEGGSVVQGLKAWVNDVLHHRAMPQQIRPDAYEVGVDLALTPGAVVFRHELFELIQYAPATPQVQARPLLLVPPQINKFYVFDLKPDNSILGWLTQQGLQVFTLSWRNPDAAMRDAGLQAYVQATLQAMEVVRAITASATLGLISACAGGLTALSAMGVLAMQRRRTVAHHSLLVTAPLPDSGSVLEVLASREALFHSVAWSAQTGTMDGADLAHLFAWLRPHDLVWSYWVNNYLLGRQPPSLDVLFWDNDATRLPAALHRDFVDMIDRRVFERPGALQLCGTAVDFRRLKVDGYYVGGSEDYLMPWHGVYRAARHFGGDNTFVLSNSGHVQSILRPPRLPRTEHYLGTQWPPQADDWLRHAQKQEGSWWPHWSGWMRARAGRTVRAPRALGSAAFPVLQAAPGSYVHGA